MLTDLARWDGREPLRFGGGYVYASWFLTGESRRYRGGRFRGVRPQGRFGAWELAARYSVVDLGDGMVEGGRERNLTLGLNVYPVAWGRVMLDYVHARADGVAGGQGESADVLQGRLQVTF
jgi:phosphate-selective porin OprO/OprP